MKAAEWPIWINAAVFAGSAAIVWVAGTRLAGYADGIATRTGIGRVFLGMLLLGGVTSLPELAVAITASLQGTPLLSVTEVLGSAAINVTILAIADAFIGRDALTSVQGSPGVMLQGVLGITIMAMAIGATLTGDTLLAGIGAWSWLMLLVYLGSIWLLARSRTERAWHPSADRGGELAEREESSEQRALHALIRRAALAAVAILVAGFLLARTGDALAQQSGLGTSFFGAVILGLSTSLPEMSTVIAAVRLRRFAMAISDVFGTNLFNVTIIVLVDALHPGGPVLLEAGRFASFGALLTLVLTAIYLVGLLERRDRVVLRMGVDSLLVVTIYCAGIVVLYGLR